MTDDPYYSGDHVMIYHGDGAAKCCLWFPPM